MTITATMAVSNATPKSEQQVTATVTVSNSAGTAVNVTAIVPTLTPHSATTQSVAGALGYPLLGGNFAVAVAASGSTNFSWSVMAHAPVTSYNVGAEPSSYVYDVGALIYTSDGAITSATTTTLTVGYPGT